MRSPANRVRLFQCQVKPCPSELSHLQRSICYRGSAALLRTAVANDAAKD